MSTNSGNNSPVHGQHNDKHPLTPNEGEQAASAGKTKLEQTDQKQEQTGATAPAHPRQADRSPSQVKTSGRKPGEYSPPLGQDSGSDWQESQQMGDTGHGGVQSS